ncbi:hypothetical protein PFISCL1PPCAC_22758, partial [Pristionchus fissidentatus]
LGVARGALRRRATRLAAAQDRAAARRQVKHGSVGAESERRRVCEGDESGGVPHRATIASHRCLQPTAVQKGVRRSVLTTGCGAQEAEFEDGQSQKRIC